MFHLAKVLIPGFAIFLTLFSGAPALAQEGEGADYYEEHDELVLKDGSKLKGRIIKMNKDSVRIELTNGEKLAFDRSEIGEVRFNVSPTSTEKRKDPLEEGASEKEKEELEPRYKEGYENHFMHGWFANAGDRGFNLSFLGNPWVGSLHTYRFSPHFSAGILLNFHFFLGGNFNYPGGLNDLSIHLQGDILEHSKLTPFWYLQGGYLLSLQNTLFGANNRTGPRGTSAIGGAGAKIYYKGPRAVSLSLGYQFMRTKTGLTGSSGSFTRYTTVKGLAVRIGLHF